MKGWASDAAIPEILPTTTKQLSEWQAEAVENALQDPDPEIVAAAANWLAESQASHPRLMHRLMHRLAALFSAQEPIRTSAVYALGKLGPPAAPYANDIARLLESADAGAAAVALVNLGPTAMPYAGNIAELLKSDNRYAAAYTLGKLGPPAGPDAKDITELIMSG